MSRRIWFIWIGLIILLFLLSSSGSSALSAWSFIEDLPQTASSQIIVGPGSLIELSMYSTPEAVTPGQSFNLNLEVKNNSDFQIFPEITVEIPDVISVEMLTLPAGAMFDVQNGRVSWQPIVEGQGTVNTISLQFTANVASMLEPIQEITGQLRLGDEVHTVSAPVWIGVLPAASISFDPPQAAVGQPIQVKARVSGPGPISQEWYIGDGRVVEAQDPAIIFPSAGNYQVTLKASNPLGFSTTQAEISVIPQPIAHFEPADRTVLVGQEAIFLNESGGAPPLQYSWDFYDGYGSQEVEPQHIFAEAGTYLVHLVVQNEFGRSEAYAEVIVGEPPISDAIIPEEGTAGQIVNLAAFTDDSVTDVSWDMGDGRSVYGREPRHVYWAAGDYQVQMTAQNEFGSTTVSQQIHINQGYLFLYLPMAQSLDRNLGSDGSNVPDDGLVINDGLGPSNSGETPLAKAESQPVDGSDTIDQLESLEFPDDAGPADKLLAYINLARSINNMRPLRYVHELSVAAQRHTDDMANNNIAGHTGSDDSSPALRILQAGYPGGYGGEATAWGMDDPIEPVEFWLNSPGHRAILLHPAVSDVGVGYTLNYDSSNIWHWTAEFGSLSLPQIVVLPTPPPEEDVPAEETTGEPEGDLVIQLLGPPKESSFDLDPENILYFTWSRKKPLDDGQSFNLILGAEGTDGVSLGSVSDSIAGSQYQLVVSAGQIASGPGNNFWQIRLSGGVGQIISESEKWPIILNQIDIVEIEQTATPTPTAAATETPENVPQPTLLPLSTPLPTPTP